VLAASAALDGVTVGCETAVGNLGIFAMAIRTFHGFVTSDQQFATRCCIEHNRDPRCCASAW